MPDSNAPGAEVGDSRAPDCDIASGCSKLKSIVADVYDRAIVKGDFACTGNRNHRRYVRGSLGFVDLFERLIDVRMGEGDALKANAGSRVRFQVFSFDQEKLFDTCLLYTSPSPRDRS